MDGRGDDGGKNSFDIRQQINTHTFDNSSTYHLQTIHRLSTDHPHIIYKSSTDHLQNNRSSTNRSQITYKSPTTHPQIVYKSSTEHLQISDRSSTNQRQIIYKASTDHSHLIDDLHLSGQICPWSAWPVWVSPCCPVGAAQSAWSSTYFLGGICTLYRSSTASHNGSWGRN